MRLSSEHTCNLFYHPSPHIVSGNLIEPNFTGSQPMPGSVGSTIGASILQKTASVLKYSSFVFGLLQDALATS